MCSGIIRKRKLIEGEKLMNATELTINNFDAKTSDGRVLVSFWANWCGPCMALYPTIDEVAAESGGRYTVGRVDVDKQGELASRFKVMSIPTAVVLDNGKEIKRFVGAERKDTYITALTS